MINPQSDISSREVESESSFTVIMEEYWKTMAGHCRYCTVIKLGSMAKVIIELFLTSSFNKAGVNRE